MSGKLEQHEALHTAFVLISTWSEHVTKNSFVQSEPHLLELAQKAEDTMAELYQAVGAADAADNPGNDTAKRQD